MSAPIEVVHHVPCLHVPARGRTERFGYLTGTTPVEVRGFSEAPRPVVPVGDPCDRPRRPQGLGAGRQEQGKRPRRGAGDRGGPASGPRLRGAHRGSGPLGGGGLPDPLAPVLERRSGAGADRRPRPGARRAGPRRRSRPGLRRGRRVRRGQDPAARRGGLPALRARPVRASAPGRLHDGVPAPAARRHGRLGPPEAGRRHGPPRDERGRREIHARIHSGLLGDDDALWFANVLPERALETLRRPMLRANIGDEGRQEIADLRQALLPLKRKGRTLSSAGDDLEAALRTVHGAARAIAGLSDRAYKASRQLVFRDDARDWTHAAETIRRGPLNRIEARQAPSAEDAGALSFLAP